MASPRTSEDNEQAAVVEYCRLLHIPIWASASGIYCPTVHFAHKLKRLGVIQDKGEPDLFIPVVKRKEGVIIAGGMFIEMKKKGGRASKEQLERVAYYNEHGYVARVIEGAEGAIAAIQEYVEGE